MTHPYNSRKLPHYCKPFDKIFKALSCKTIIKCYNSFVAVDEYFKVKTPLGVTIRTTKAYWQRIITTKHPSVAKHGSDVKEALKNPDEIRRSKQDIKVHLYYLDIGKVYVCIVADNVNNKEGYIITAYLTDRIKEGEQIYVKN